MKRKDITRAANFDPSIPRVTVEIEGESFDLCFDFRAMATAKAKLRALDPPIVINILQAIDFRDLDIDMLPALFYAATQRYHPELTFERVGELITMRNVVGIYSALASAYVAAVRPGGDEANPPVAVQATQTA